MEIEDPDDDDALLVLADSLGGEHGELIVLQHRLENHPELQTREVELRKAIERALNGYAKVDCTWRMGFIRQLQIDIASARAHDLRAILDHSHARFVDDLILLMGECGDGDELIPVIAERERPWIRQLNLFEGYGDPSVYCEESTAALWTKLPRLEEVVLRSERPMFSSMSHDSVHEMDLGINPFGDDWEWELPRLETLTWDPHIESDCTITVIDRLWEQKLPKLTELVLEGLLYNDGDPLLGRSDVREFIRRLREFTVPIRAITNRTEAVEHILANTQHVAHLEKLTITNARLDDDDVARLTKALPNIEVE